MKKSVIVDMQTGLEARPIANLVHMANQFASQIYLEVNEKKVNAKSIMGMMSLALMSGESIVLHAEGSDEAEAIAALEEFLTK